MNRFNHPSHTRQRSTHFIILLVLIFNFISFIPIYGQANYTFVYKNNTTTLSNENKAILSAMAVKIKKNSNCKIDINGYLETSNASQTICQKRVELIKTYLIEKEGIPYGRIIANCSINQGDKNTVDIKSCGLEQEIQKCTLGDLGSLVYKGATALLSNDNKAILSTIAAKLKDNPLCSISFNGYPSTGKAAQNNCQKRLENIKIYLFEKEGISADRITTSCGEAGAGDPNTVDIKHN